MMPILGSLALLPIAHFISQYIISSRDARLHELKNNYAIIYLDWIFVPFNLLLPFAVTFSWTLFLPMSIIAIGGSIILNNAWKNIKNKPKETLFIVNDKGFTSQGKIHLIFMSVQAAIVITAFASRAVSRYYLALLGLVMAYCLGYLTILIFVRKVRLRSKVETPILILGILLLCLRGVIFLKAGF